MQATNYKEVAALRLVNPLNLLARYGRAHRGEGDTLEAFLQREYGPHVEGTDLEAVGRSIEADAADITAILDEYPEPNVTYDAHDDVHCLLCSADVVCVERFENDAADVAMEADAPYLDVLIWLHDQSLSSLSDGITSLAARYTKDVEEARLARETLERLLG